MASIKPSTPKGTRDFSPTEMVRRNFIFDTIKGVFRKYGYQQIETPAMENSSTLLGKYGDEGDKLIFKILESGEFMFDVNADLTQKFNPKYFERDLRTFIKDVIDVFSIHVFESNSYKNNYEELVESFFSTDNVLFENKRPYYLNTFKKTFNNYLYKKGTATKFKNHRNRISYYLSIEDKSKKFKEIYKGLNYIIYKNYIYDEILALDAFTNNQLQSIDLAPKISKKALRYDLTVPFARYVVMHQNEITFPFKRFQVQPVWRADRPQRGRYREFYQCDADVVGSPSLLNEAEFIMIYDEALSKLGLKDFTIKINNRKILSGIAEVVGKADNIIDLTVAIDKLDKIGLDGVTKELLEKGFTAEDIEKIKPVILLEGTNEVKLQSLRGDRNRI
jgi:histidyl-tRNA synthetase